MRRLPDCGDEVIEIRHGFDFANRLPAQVDKKLDLEPAPSNSTASKESKPTSRCKFVLSSSSKLSLPVSWRITARIFMRSLSVNALVLVIVPLSFPSAAFVTLPRSAGGRRLVPRQAALHLADAAPLPGARAGLYRPPPLYLGGPPAPLCRT